jgi:hypothetical protein
MQAEWVGASRRLSPRLISDLLQWTGPQIAGTFRREDPRARTASVSWAGPGPVPAWLDQARELSEYWIHRQQLLQGLGRPSDLRTDLAAGTGWYFDDQPGTRIERAGAQERDFPALIISTA